jgi:hypothetical protein
VSEVVVNTSNNKATHVKTKLVLYVTKVNSWIIANICIMQVYVCLTCSGKFVTVLASTSTCLKTMYYFIFSLHATFLM